LPVCKECSIEYDTGIKDCCSMDCHKKDLANKTLLPARTVRLALSHLLKKGYVKKKVSIRDARQKIYEISKIK